MTSQIVSPVKRAWSAKQLLKLALSQNIAWQVLAIACSNL